MRNTHCASSPGLASSSHFDYSLLFLGTNTHSAKLITALGCALVTFVNALTAHANVNATKISRK